MVASEMAAAVAALVTAVTAVATLVAALVAALVTAVATLVVLPTVGGGDVGLQLDGKGVGVGGVALGAPAGQK